MNRRLYYTIEKLFCFFPPIRNKTVFIFGGPRSGSTILMELIAEYPNYYSIGEPLYEKRFNEVKKLPLKGRLQVEPAEENVQLEKLLNKILDRKVRNELPGFYPNNFKTVFRLIFGRRQVVKFVRASRMVEWVLKRFPHQCAFFIIRHPLAVVSSQIRNNISALYPDNSRPDSKQLAMETSENKDLSPGLRDELGAFVSELSEPCELYAVLWCLDNLEILKAKEDAGYSIVAYEALIANPEPVLSKISLDLGQEKTPGSVWRVLKRPSSSTFRMKDFDISSTTNSFRKYLSEEDIDKVMSIVKKFGFVGYDREGRIAQDECFLKEHPNLIF